MKAIVTISVNSDRISNQIVGESRRATPVNGLRRRSERENESRPCRLGQVWTWVVGILGWYRNPGSLRVKKSTSRFGELKDTPSSAELHPLVFQGFSEDGTERQTERLRRVRKAESRL